MASNRLVVNVDYQNPQHAADLVYLLDHYARDPMGGATALDPSVKQKLVGELANLPHAFSVLCYVDGRPAGLVNCFDAFSTFECKPLVNIHDVVVAGPYRGQGISRMMLQHVERIAVEKGCCKLSLEVLAGNTRAQQAYLGFGFTAYELDPAMGEAQFWHKPLGGSDASTSDDL